MYKRPKTEWFDVTKELPTADGVYLVATTSDSEMATGDILECAYFSIYSLTPEVNYDWGFPDSESLGVGDSNMRVTHWTYAPALP